MPIGFQCPRDDLGCSAAYATTADLDNHTRYAHFYYRATRFFEGFHRVRTISAAALNISPRDTALPAAAGPGRARPSAASPSLASPSPVTAPAGPAAVEAVPSGTTPAATAAAASAARRTRDQGDLAAADTGGAFGARRRADR